MFRRRVLTKIEGKLLEEQLLTMTDISKYFPGVTALDKVNFAVDRGEVVILVGENGAGKSTLMKIIAGVHKHDTGKILLEGKPVEFANPAQAKSAGVSIVYQEQALIPDLNAVENIFIAEEETLFLDNSIFGILDRSSMRHKAAKLLEEAFAVEIDLLKPVKDIALVEKQIVEIIRAIIHNARILILDEPTAALEESERDHLFRFINRIKELGVGIIYCSHYIEECIEIGDRIVAIRDGRNAGEVVKENASINKVIEMMIGKKISDQYPKQKVTIGSQPVLEVRGLSYQKEYRSVDFNLYPGEILGIGGLAGCGKSALARTLFGIHRPDEGEILLNRERVERTGTASLIEQGVAFLPSDRKNEGLFLNQSLRYNISIANLKSVEKPFIRKRLEHGLAENYIGKISIKTPSSESVVRQLSGGNQQKAMIARWIATEPKIIIFEEPTRGIDVNAKVEVYRLIGDVVANGGAVVVVSSEVQELEGICDRAIVMHAGRISRELSGSELTKENITYYSITSEEMERKE